MSESTNPSPISEKSADRRLIELMISEMKIGDILTYQSLSTALERDVRRHCYSHLLNARRSLELKGVFTDVIPNEGIKRIPDSEVAPTRIERSRRHIKRMTTRNIRVLSAVDFKNLTEDEKRTHVSYSAQMCAVEHLSTVHSNKKILSKVSGDSTVAVGSTLQLFVK